MTETDTALVSRARGGDHAAFEEIVRRTSRLVFAHLYLDTGNADRAEELLQETYLLALRSIRKLVDPSGFRSWLLSIAHNVLIDSFRKEQKRKQVFQGSENSLLSVPARGLSPIELVQRNEIRQRVLAILRSMPDEYRLPLSLRYLAGADYETISEQLGLTNGSLRGLLHRGLKMFRDRLPPDLAPEFSE